MRQGHLANAEMQKRLRDRERLRERQLRDDFGHVLSTPQGRRVMHQLIFERCFVDRPVPTGPDGLRIEGRRDVGIELVDIAKRHFRKGYALMVSEGLDDEANEEVLRKEALNTSPVNEADEGDE